MAKTQQATLGMEIRKCHNCGWTSGDESGWRKSPSGKRYCPQCNVVRKSDQGQPGQWEI